MYSLSPHFTLEELTASETAARLGIANSPPDEALANLRSTAHVLEQVRVLLGVPVIVTSGYRCLELNRRIGSSDTSAHVKGLAADFIAPRFGSPLEICRALELQLPYDQLIHEFGGWVHLGLALRSPRGEVLTICKSGTRMGLHPC